MTEGAAAGARLPARPAFLAARAVELVAMFVAGPFLYLAIAPQTGWLFPALWGWWCACVLLLARERGFGWGAEWGFGALRREIGPMLGLFALLAPLIGVGVWLAPGLELFSLPRRNTGLWAAIMLLYPLFSVAPQEVIFRTFFFRRYRSLLGGGAWMVWASAGAFGLVHVIFGNWVAVAMTVVGGALFSRRYARTGSLACACVEHALYGCLVFTIGLNRFFYSGAVH